MKGHRRPTRQSKGWRRENAQEMRNILGDYKRAVDDHGDTLGTMQGARLLKLGEKLCILLDKEGYEDIASDVNRALRPLYEELRERKEER